VKKVNRTYFTKTCRKLYKCTQKGNEKERCRFIKNEHCKTVKKVKTYSKTVCGSHSWSKKSNCKCAATNNLCVSSGDPHYTSFSKKKFNFYGKGDFILLKTGTVTVHTRQKKWGRTSVNTAIAVKLNKKTSC